MSAWDALCAWVLAISGASAVVVGLLPAMASLAMSGEREKKFFRFGMAVAISSGAFFVVWLIFMGFVRLVQVTS